ncbi:mannose-specific lectin-like [Simochromis diagramma]|uniref:mannose-specific lectin-like n=1 Tax=Simochromis diagramma TaxID=43689 RepID=UPI001A7EA903|nr:mannose-specific lectin-like [Simochromis diagramma]
MSKNSISTDQELRKGESLVSVNGNFKAILQEDGNFVVYKWSPIWATATNGKNPARLLLQGDSNLVLYTQDDKPVWSSGTVNPDNRTMRLTLTNDGRLVVTRNGAQIWSSRCLDESS